MNIETCLTPGSDPLPFNFLKLEPELCEKAVFVDVDYPKLIQKKCEIIRETAALKNVIPDMIEHPNIANIPITSARYHAVACNLEDLQTLDNILGQELEAKETALLFIAEVSITYMEAKAAERILASTASLPDGMYARLSI